MSNTNQTMEEAGKSYLEANRAINMKYIYGSDKIYYAGEEGIIPSERRMGISNELENNIIENTVYFNEMYVDELTNQLFEQQETGRITVEDLQQSIYRITIGVISHDALINLDISSLYSDTGFIIMTLCKCKDLRECKTKLKSFLHTIGRRLNEVKIKMPNQTILKIKKYIETYYAVPELSLSQIAEEFCFSPAYLSTLFKKNCSQNITDYINAVRIDQACSLLEMGEDKISLISEKVGYSNTSYFYKVFKRIKGCPPKDYRERIGI